METKVVHPGENLREIHILLRLRTDSRGHLPLLCWQAWLCHTSRNTYHKVISMTLDQSRTFVVLVSAALFIGTVQW
jgi:hypothetical protein